VFVRKLAETPEFLAGDHTILRELLHPAKTPVEVRFSVAHGRLQQGGSSKRHRLSTSEVYYFLNGLGLIRVGKQLVPNEPGLLVYVPPGTVQSVQNTGWDDLVFLCLVDPAWRPPDEEILEE
jgi:mannose-6-phosphate isomerase-like protein (cupin superfamily)